MRRGGQKQRTNSRPPEPAGGGAEGRAQALLTRLETGGGNPVQAAEELDRMLTALTRDGNVEGVAERAEQLCLAWADTPLRGEKAQAWVTLVGAFNLREHVEQVAELATDAGLPAPLRERACRVLARLRGGEALAALQAVLLSTAPAPLRAAAAEALAEAGDRSVAPVLQALLDEEIPRPVWTAVSAALDRLR